MQFDSIFLRYPIVVALAAVALIFFSPGSPAVHAQESFFKGKTITIVQGRDPGGTGDMRVRATLPFLQKYIPGNPTIVSEFMPGGGSRKAANYVYKSARPDGLTIGNLGLGMIFFCATWRDGGAIRCR